jgi:menaquinone-dependent protoporphyrinogen oxidase
MSKLCIAYVTKTNTTKEIAEEIAKVAREKSWEVKVLPVSAIDDPEEFDAILIGAPINGMQWLPEAIEFVENNQVALKKISTSYYLVSYLMNSGGKRWKKMIDKSLKKVSALVKPLMIGKFDGRVEDEFGTIPRLLFGLKKDTPLDLRDWDAIRTWAREYLEELEVSSR